MDVYSLIMLLRLLTAKFSNDLSANWLFGLIWMTAQALLPVPPDAWPFVKRLLDGEPRALPLLAAKLFIMAPVWALCLFAVVTLGRRVGFVIPALLATNHILTSPELITLMQGLLGETHDDSLIIAAIVLQVAVLGGCFWRLNAYPKSAVSSQPDTTRSTAETATESKIDDIEAPASTPPSEKETANVTAAAHHVTSLLLTFLMAWLVANACLDGIKIAPLRPLEAFNSRSDFATKLGTALRISQSLVYAVLLMAYFSHAARTLWHVLLASSTAALSLVALHATASEPPTWDSWSIDAWLAFLSFNLGLLLGVLTQGSQAADQLFVALGHISGNGGSSSV